MADHDLLVLELHSKYNLPYDEIGRMLNLTYKQVNHAIDRARKSQRIKFQNKKEYTEEDVNDYIEQMIKFQEAHHKLSNKQTEAVVTLDEDKPVGIVPSGDWHLGNQGVDYQRFEEDFRKIRDTEGIYLIGKGDYKDNYKPGTPLAGMFDQLVQPGNQDLLVFHYIKQLRGKIICLVKGNHDNWDQKVSDKDFVDNLSEEGNTINLWHGGLVRIGLGDTEYTWRARHKYRYTSSLNFENSMRRLMEIHGPSDIASEAHFHNPYIMERIIMEEYRVLVRSGSYKVSDDYGQLVGGFEGKPCMPMIILSPNERNILPFRDMDSGIKILEQLRS